MIDNIEPVEPDRPDHSDDRDRSDILCILRQVSEGEPEIVLDLRPKTNSRMSEASPTSSEDVGHSCPPDSDDHRRLLSETEKTVSTCQLCDLSRSRQNVVFGVGNPSARLMFIGEAPGADEDRLGEPFVGRAGKLLDKILAAMNLTREDVYIANILKCRPPANRNPSDDEAKVCIPYLHRQIEIIQPDLLVALGLVAAVRLLNLKPTTTLKSLRGRILNFNQYPLMATYHPAALLRNPHWKVPAWEDFQQVMKFLSGEISWDPPSI